MKRVKIAELKNALSEHLRSVENGGEVLVTDRDRPIARIVPVEKLGGRIRILPSKLDFSAVRKRRHSPARWGISSTRLLLEERQKR